MLGDNTKFTPGPLLRYFIDYLNRLLQFRAYTNEPISYEKDVKIDEEIKTLISVMSVLHKMERRTRLIAQYNKRGVLVGVFGSSKDAEILTGVSQGQINKLTSP